MKQVLAFLLALVLCMGCAVAGTENRSVMRTMGDVEAAIAGCGLSEYYEEIGKTVRNSVRIVLTPAAEEEIPTGASKMGGLPDLPEGVDWFREEAVDVPLSFICQINFAEVKPYDTENKLPDQGMLYFFYNCAMYVSPWSYDPYDEDSWAVFYYDGDTSLLTRRTAPGDLTQKGCVFAPAGMCFAQALDLPDWYSGAAEEIRKVIREEDHENYTELTGDAWDAISNKLLGHSDNIQFEMEAECEQETGKTGNWHLLLQMDSNENLGMMWGDGGRLYLWITDEDLAARDFSSSWLIMQCY